MAYAKRATGPQLGQAPRSWRARLTIVKLGGSHAYGPHVDCSVAPAC